MVDDSGCSTKVAVVTGASSGVGRAIAKQLALNGFDVALVGRDPSRLPTNECSVTSRAKAYQCDLATGSFEGVTQLIRHDFGKINALVHCAGRYYADELDQGKCRLDQLLDVNLRAPLTLTRLLIEDLIRAKGDIVFINSSAGLSASRRTLDYSISKYGLRALADGLRDEVNAYGVRVLSIFLGSTATPMQEEIHRVEGRAYVPEELIQSTDVGQLVSAVLSLPRTAEVTDIMLRPLVKPH